MPRELLIHGLRRRGGTAEILDAEERQEGGVRRRVVVKRLRAELEEECSAAFLDEARLLAQLAHPGVVRLLGTERLDGRIVQILEPLDGLTLGEWLSLSREQGRPMPRAAALEVLHQLARALAHVHGAKGVDGTPLGIVHRDLSPENVMLTRGAELKLLDFGIARALRREAQTVAGQVKGTPGFLAPEQWRGGRLDPRTDLYLLGLLAWFLLEGTSPTQDTDRWLSIVEGEVLVPPPSWPEGLRQLVARLLEFDPERRPRSARVVAESLAALMEQDGPRDESEALAEWLAGLESSASAPRPVAAHPLEALFDFGAGEEGSAGAGTRRVLEFHPAEVVQTQAAESTWVTWAEGTETLEPSVPSFDRTQSGPTLETLSEALLTPTGAPSGPLVFTPTPSAGAVADATWSVARPSYSPSSPGTSSGGRALALRLLLLALVTLGGLLLGWWIPSLLGSGPGRSPAPPRPAVVREAEPARAAVAGPALAAEPEAQPDDPAPGLEADPAPYADTPEEDEAEAPPASAATDARSAPRRGRRAEPRAPRAGGRDERAAEPEATGAPRPSQPPAQTAERVKQGLEALAQQIRRSRARLSAESLRAFESRYFDLRAAYRPGLDPERLAGLEARIRELSAALAAAGEGGAP